MTRAACALCGLLCISAGRSPAFSQVPAWSGGDVRHSHAPSIGVNRAVPGQALGRFDLIAIRVAFEPDTTQYTTGDGTFGDSLFDGLSPAIDPFPHDRDYFAAHLSFLEHYVSTVSGGRAEVVSHLADAVVTVSQPMETYSPLGLDAGSDEELRKLAALVAEAWDLADDGVDLEVADLDPDRTAFVLFHAGVGRDIELTGTTLDKTPLDLPSIAFDREALIRLLPGGLPSFKGLSVTNTLVLPRTETRKGFDFIAEEPYLIELSTNGLIAASFFNFLGVPDLFNTVTGESGIGPFGLMDPLGIFALSGLVPPRPGAWTRAVLGWDEPVVASGDSARFAIAGTEQVSSDPTIVKVPVSTSEYFLVENRNRDPGGDGFHMTIWRPEGLVEQVVQNGDPDFNPSNTGGFIGGVVVAVDDHDWGLPGGLRSDGGELNGGILVWHIDERLISENGPTNTVNADPRFRGVDVEEADGSQDIGFPSGGLGPSFELGSPFDFYFAGNDFTVVTSSGQEIILYENRFGADTYPDSRSNSGGPSFVTLDEFSDTGPVMTFRYLKAAEESTEVLLSVSGATKIQGSDASASLAGDRIAVYSGSDGLEDGALGIWQDGALVETLPTSSRPAMRGDLIVRQWRDVEAGTVAMQRTSGDESTTLVVDGLSAEDESLSPVVLSPTAEEAYALWRKPSGSQLVRLDLSGDAVELIDASDATDMAVSDAGTVLLVGAAGVRTLAGEPLWVLSRSSEARGRSVFGKVPKGTVGVVPDAPARRLFALSPGAAVMEIDLAVYAESIADPAGAYPVLADIDRDSELEIISTIGHTLVAFERSGAVVDGFPISMPATAVGQPLVLSQSPEGGVLVAIGGEDGYLYAYDPSDASRDVSGFPLAVGRSLGGTAFVEVGRAAALSSDGDLLVWRTTDTRNAIWGELFGSSDNRSYIGATGPDPETPDANRLLVGSETYNWPNPVRDGSTNIRVQVTRDSHVEVRIIDMAGSLIGEMDMGVVEAGLPTERSWTTGASSGIYYARVTATDQSGSSDSVVVKIAVIR